jgi:hypothetical protein
MKSKHGGFTGNLVKLGGAHKKLSLSGDMRPENMVSGTSKKAQKQAHKKV